MTALLTDRPRLVLEDALAAVLDADQHAHCAVLRLVNRARTAEEAEIITEMIAVRRALRQARNHIAAYHPQRLAEPEIMQIVEQRVAPPVEIRVDGTDASREVSSPLAENRRGVCSERRSPAVHEDITT